MKICSDFLFYKANKENITMELFNGTISHKKRKSPEGIATNNLIFSAYIGNNNDVFPQVLKL